MTTDSTTATSTAPETAEKPEPIAPRGPMTDQPQPGDDCPCGHYLTVTTTRVDEKSGLRVRYLSCRQCGVAPADNVVVVPLSFAPRHRKRNSSGSPTSRTKLHGSGSTGGDEQ